MKKLWSMLIWAILLGACGKLYRAPSDRVTPTLENRAIMGLAVGLEQGGTIETPERVILEYPSFTVVYVPLLAPSTPTPTDTPSPSATPSSTSFLTPTPPPTNTPRPSNTPESQPSPTQESTALPTIAPTQPPLKICTLRNAHPTGAAINIRPDASTTSAPIGIWAHGTEKQFVEFTINEGLLWAKHATAGWSAIRVQDTGVWWVAGTAGAGECVDVLGWPDGLEPPGAFAKAAVALGFHSIPGANANNLKLGYALAAQIPIPASTKNYGDSNLCIDAILAEVPCIFRNPPGSQDCPYARAVDPRYEARHWMDLIKATSWGVWEYRHSGLLWLEPLNECAYDFEFLYWWRDFLDEAIEYAHARDYPPLALPGFGPGWGDQDTFRIWAGPLKKLRDYGGLLSSHNYSISKTVGLCEYNQWLADRHDWNHQWMDLYGYGDLKIAITEAGRAGGEMSVDVTDFVCYYLRIRNNPVLHSVAFWLAGYHPLWPDANLDNYIVPITLAIGQALQ